jgi:O-Antigen ligase
MATVALSSLVLSRAGSTFSDRWLFRLVGAFWLSQAFLIPIAAIGPWPAWPTWADLIVGLMVPLIFLSDRGLGHAREIVLFVAAGTTLCAVSFAWATVFYGTDNRGAAFGMALLCRLAEYIIALIATAKISLSVRRIRVLSRLSVIVFFAISVGIFITALLPLAEALAAIRLPIDESGGPWFPYASGLLYEGVGFVSYNHGYTSVQLLLALGLTLSLNNFSKRSRVLLYLVALAAALFTQSRAGFLCMLLLIVSAEIRRSKAVLTSVVIISLAAGAYLFRNESVAEVIERQQSSSSALSDDGLGGRTEFWKAHADYFVDHPFAIFTGTGFGYSEARTGQNAHMLYLHVLTEVGIFGLMAFLFFHYKLLHNLAVSKPMYWTVLVLLISGVTQETLWPTLAFTHFVGFYFSALAAAVRIKGAPTVTITVSPYTAPSPQAGPQYVYAR